MTTIPGCVNAVRARTPVSGQGSANAEPLSPVAALVRRHDRDRFQTALFAPAARREALFALYAFNYEIARVRESVTHPTLGRIRLEWWRESIAAAYDGAPVRRHPVAEAVTVVIRERWPTHAHFDRLIDAREADFDETAPADLAELEAYAEGTSSRLIYLALEVLGVRDDAAALSAGCEVGIAFALTGLLRALPFQTGLGRRIIPVEIARRCGLQPHDFEPRAKSAGLRRAVAEIAAAAKARLEAARQTRACVPAAAIAALLPAVVADRSLRRLKRAGYDPFAPGLQLRDPLQAWHLAGAALRRRF
jgi:NADH dehydrogenase [ubiquinone] 1 alpha subcomplex assembly factor 6